MNYRRWISILLAGSMLFGASISLIGCQKEETPDVPDTPVSDSDTTPEVPEVPAVPLPKLATLTLDDGTELNFDIKSGESAIFVEFETVSHFEKRPYGLNVVKCGSLIFSLPIQYTVKMHEYEQNGVIRKYPYCDYE